MLRRYQLFFQQTVIALRSVRLSQSANRIRDCPQRLYSSTIAMSAKGSKVYITSLVPQSGVTLLKEAGCVISQWPQEDSVPREQFLKDVVGADALYCSLCQKIDKELLQAAGPQLKVVSTLSVGYDHVDVAECAKRNIRLGNTPDVLTKATAELGVALLLTVSRNIEKAVHAVKSGEWSSWKSMWLCGSGLEYSTVGIVGMGRIGTTLLQMLQPFGVSRFLYSSKRGARELPVEAECVEFRTLLKESDFVIVCCSLTPETKDLFRAETFSQMKKTAIFINISRGAVVNQEDLYDSLKNETILAAGLDVTTPEPLPTDSPLLSLDNCTILPHIGSATTKARSIMSELTAKNILAALEGKPMPAEIKL
ncbi:glyoxylate reductase/hydroxypyruvate reductase [Octopus sinensis]|uniref:Glyoxylate reductase/hydroxypyruvate reductase n=1 Tax=Octopus sinensis TaxID=2607531 RepID=A0A6P7SUL8_9MOLL|nr:glyoxylate reductase/hydroxypyruvate reductase [Octopus sinensis]